MKKIHLFLTVIILAVFFTANAQTPAKNAVIFRNASVLFKKEGKMVQQIIAAIKSEQPTEITFSISGEAIQKDSVKSGDNLILLNVSAVSAAKNIDISVTGANGLSGTYPLTLIPVKKWEVYLAQHAHTDIGYTRPQSEILAEHMRYIDYALDYCDQTDDLADGARFRWTCESAWVTREYLRSRPSAQIERLKKRIAQGRIEVTAMYCNMAEISDENSMVDFLQPLKEFSKLGIPVKTAMQDDVNGIAWCMPDYFKNTGVKYLNMGINETRSILPFDKATCFWWEAPSGARLLAFRADHYMTGNFFGMETKSIKAANLLNHLAVLDEKNYPFDKISVQFSGYFTDNSPPSTAACELVKAWNETHESPKLRLSVVGEFFDYVENKYGSSLPVYRNAWLDWWSDGYGSTSRETAEVRKTQNMKQVDEGLFAMVSMMGGDRSPALESNIDHISENAIFFDEHTCGADESISNPYSENSTRQWLQKGAYAWEALKKVTLLHEEALARFQPFLKKGDFPLIYVINTLGWNRSASVELFVDYQILPVDRRCTITDIATGEEVTAQLLRKRAEGAYWAIEVKKVPALGYKALKIEISDQPLAAEPAMDNEILENKYYKITLNKLTGSIISLFDKVLNEELADSQNPYGIGQPVKETSKKRDIAPFIHTSVSNVKIEKVDNGAVWQSVKISSDLEGFEKGEQGSPKGIDLEIRLFKNVKKIEFKYMARKLIVTDPEALYVAFPFSLPDSRIVFETIGGVLTQGEQLPGSSSDWNVAQNFVAVRGKKGQIIVVSNEVPLWQFSDFNMNKYERYPKQGKTWLYSYVMNNYWMTNFRAFQEGAFSWSYQVTSTVDTTNTTATKFAWGERNSFATRTIPSGKNELVTPLLETIQITGSENALIINSRPNFKNSSSIILHLREVEGLAAEVKLKSTITTRPIKRIVEVNAIGKELGVSIPAIHLKPFEVKFVEVDF